MQDMVCSMTRSRSRSRALQSWKSGHFQKLSHPPFTTGAGNWQPILKLYITAQYLNWIAGRIFDICPSFCVTWLTSARSIKSFLDFNEIWYVRTGRDEWCTTVCSMTRSNVKVTIPSKLEIRPFSKARPISSVIYNGTWQLTNDS